MSIIRTSLLAIVLILVSCFTSSNFSYAELGEPIPLPPEQAIWTQCTSDANCTAGLKCVLNNFPPPVQICAECDSADDCLALCSDFPCNGYEEQVGCDDGYVSNGADCCCDASSGPPYLGAPYCEDNKCKFSSRV